jgi:hypothetical protein
MVCRNRRSRHKIQLQNSCFLRSNTNNTVKMSSSDERPRIELWTQLGNAINLRSSQDQVLWTVLGFFGTTNAVLLSTMFASGDFPKNTSIQGILVTCGLLLSFAWHVIQGRAIGHIKRHESVIALIERTLDIPEGMAISGQINRSTYDRYLGSGISARQLITGFGWCSALLWAVVGTVCLARTFGYFASAA